MNKDEIIYEISKRTDEKIVFSLAEFKCRKYAHIRTWVRNPKGQGDNAWVCTQKGICISIALIEELVNGVSALALAVDSTKKG
jgi:hypothetical protein